MKQYDKKSREYETRNNQKKKKKKKHLTIRRISGRTIRRKQ